MSNMFGKLGWGHIFEGLEYYTEVFQLFFDRQFRSIEDFWTELEEKYEMARIRL